MADTTPHANVASAIRQLAIENASLDGLKECLQDLSPGQTATLDSVWGSARAAVAAMLSHHLGQPLVLVCPDGKSAANLYDDLESFCQTGDTISRFPVCQIGMAETQVIDPEFGERLRLVKQILLDKTPEYIVTSVDALLQPTPSPQQLESQSRILKVGARLDLADFRQWLDASGFQSTSAVELAGEYSFRGGIVDVYANDWFYPIRIELFDDEIESLRHFSATTQKSIESIECIEVSVAAAGESLEGNLLDQLPERTVVALLGLEAVRERARLFLNRVLHTEPLLSVDQLQQQWAKHPLVLVESLSTGDLGRTHRFDIEPVEAVQGDIDAIRRGLDEIAGDEQVVVFSYVEGELPRLHEILSSTQAAARGNLKYCVGRLHEAFRWRSENTLFIGSDQLFNRGQLRRTVAKRKLGKAIDSFIDLAEGDLVVHLAHGIGRFRGLKILDKEGQKTEHLDLEFHGNARIYVPASRIDLVQKYVGGTKTKPVLAKIGSKAWVKQKKAAEAAVTDLAAEMLEVQAERAARPGIAMKPDTTWQYEFEHSFPYQETPDQLSAIQAIKDDQQLPRPMDRLLCGDVGFGKTEVSMRAAFKAVENGFQVAVLVPTTILAEQHYKSFRERMAEFPLSIEKLSRFATAAEQKRTVAGLKSGKVDVVVGTHRLASKDVEFNNLGLVIIDEEQRFGVAVKERLKSLRASVDVLTMSATPIPRTLHMSLVGVRDISNLETPPAERLAVETRVTRWDDELIKQAILREIGRGGQVYFVHNRVNDIELIRHKLQHLVPDVSMEIGHGQMPEDELERVMTRFIDGKFDLLLATTIVESGLDIPNANTMIIDEANRYGLADLHQLRGRVGRYKNRAYCYLLVDPNRNLTPLASKRLHAIQRYSEIGSGFAIAMRDLEIRGAGNLLGTEQSGHIAAVGYELYCQMLENAVRAARQLPKKLSAHVDIDLPLEAFLPDDYVSDRRSKIDFYRRLTRLESFDDIRSIREELLDRFGPLPPPAKRLLKLSAVKLEASLWTIQSIFLDSKYLGFRFEDRSRIEQLVKQFGTRLRIVDDHTAYITLKSGSFDPERLLALVRSILQLKK